MRTARVCVCVCMCVCACVCDKNVVHNIIDRIDYITSVSRDPCENGEKKNDFFFYFLFHCIIFGISCHPLTSPRSSSHRRRRLHTTVAAERIINLTFCARGANNVHTPRRHTWKLIYNSRLVRANRETVRVYYNKLYV